MRMGGASTGERVPGRARVLAAGMLVLCLTVAACGGDDDTSEVAAEASTEIEDTAGDDAAGVPADGDAETVASTDGYDLPDDYPLPAPDGGEQRSALFDDASGTSNVLIAYPMESLDGLIQGYDGFFDTVGGETQRVPLTDGLASWHNDEAGYSVIVNAQNAEIQVRLQTGI